MKIVENGQLKILRNVVPVHCAERAVSDKGDSGTLVFSTGDPTVRPHAVEDLPVYGMAVGNVELANGTSFTVANRLCDILPAIRRRNPDLFCDYKELTLCNTSCAVQRDSGFVSN